MDGLLKAKRMIHENVKARRESESWIRFSSYCFDFKVIYFADVDI